MSFAVLCPGQGAQNAAMLDLIAGHSAAEAVLRQGGKAIDANPREWLAHPRELFSNAIAQPLLCLTELATWSALRDSVGEPGAFAGYSVGELAAYACAGSLDAALLARLARTRAQLMDAAAVRPGGLVAVRGLPRNAIEALCVGASVWIAIVNGEDTFVVGGETGALEAFVREAGAQGATFARLDVGVGSHTPLLDTAVTRFRSALEDSEFLAPAVPVMAGVDASRVTTRTAAIAKLSAQIAARIEWASCIDALFERGCRIFLELGPGCALSRMVRERLGSEADARSVSEFRSLEAVAGWLQRRLASD